MSDEVIMLKILESLPRDYRAIPTTLETKLREDNLTLEKLAESIRHEHKRIIKDKNGNGERDVAFAGGPFKGTCHSCGKQGHNAITVKPVITGVVVMPIKDGVGHVETILKVLEDKTIVMPRKIRLSNVPTATERNAPKFLARRRNGMKPRKKKLTRRLTAVTGNPVERQNSISTSVSLLSERGYQKVADVKRVLTAIGTYIPKKVFAISQ